MIEGIDPTKRFSARADAYAQARPSYPPEALEILRTHYGLDRLGGSGRPQTPADRGSETEMVIADLGSGTGIFTRLLLESGAVVHAVEPNADMRLEAARSLGDNPRFRSVAGRAEETTLGDRSIDLVTAAQAFHWFDLPRFKIELRRILRPKGRAAFVWNDRDLEGTPFLVEYDAILLEHCPGYQELQGKADTPSKFDAIFGPKQWSRHTARNEQRLDRDGLVARVMSASYAPPSGTAAHTALIAALHDAFERFCVKSDDNKREVTIAYTTIVIGGIPRDD